MDSAAIMIMVVCLLRGLYIIGNLPFTTPVTATHDGFKLIESEGHRGRVTNNYAVYKYHYDGWDRTYVSHHGQITEFVLQPVKKLYVRGDGEVFELESGLWYLGIAASMLIPMGLIG